MKMTSTMTNGISISGTFKNMLASGFSIRNCIDELIDDSIGASATCIRIHLISPTEVGEPAKLIICDDGAGMTEEGLKRAHILNNRSAVSSKKHGRFGHGRKAALANLTQLEHSVQTLTKTIEGDEVWQLDIKFPDVLISNALELHAHAASTKPELFWKMTAVTPATSGTITLIPLPVSIFRELDELISSNHLHTSLRYHFGVTYKNFLSDGGSIELYKNGALIGNVVAVDPLGTAAETGILHVYRTPANEIQTFYDKDGKSRRYKRNPVTDNKTWKEFDESPAEGIIHLGDVALSSAYAEDWFAVQTPVLESLGVAIPVRDGLTEFRSMLGGTFLYRNGKLIQRDPTPPPTSNTADAAHVKSIMLARHIIEFHPVESDAAVEDDAITLDDVFGIEVNKSKINKSRMNEELEKTYTKHFRAFQLEIKKKLAALSPVPVPVPVPAPPAPIITMPDTKPSLYNGVAVTPVAEKLVVTPERLAAMATFIDVKLATTKAFDKYGLTLVDSNEVIAVSLMGELRNIVLGFFSGSGCSLFKEKRCDACGSTTASQYDRAHDCTVSRKSVAIDALRRIRPDETRPVSQKAFFRAFVNEHRYHPLWYLCKPCHRTYDAKQKEEDSEE